MQVRTVQSKIGPIAVVTSDELLIKDLQSALDLIATVSFETGHSTIILDKSAICEEFFDLKTRGSL